MDERIRHIAERWYVNEPALFSVLCTHDIEPNDFMRCPIRCGRGRIEYAPSLICSLPDDILEMCLTAEVVRILLKHPYGRQIYGCRPVSMALASNVVLADNYDFSQIGFLGPRFFHLPARESFEWYAIRLETMIKESLSLDIVIKTTPRGESGCGSGAGGNSSGSSGSSSSSGGSSSDNGSGTGGGGYTELTLPDGSKIRLSTGKPDTKQSGSGKKDSPANQPQNEEKIEIRFEGGLEDAAGLWNEDPLMQTMIDNVINGIKNWGNIPGNLIAQIEAGTKASIDYRNVLSGFRASILSSKRHLTRMRPNRRTGAYSMGSIRRFNTNLLVAVDVSGSISDEAISHFYGVINRFFKYGIESIDAVQFDYDLGPVRTFTKKFTRVKVEGRGGTNFQPIFDYVAAHPKYDGLIIFTDGIAPPPVVKKDMRTKVVWICEDKAAYDAHHGWMLQSGRCCAIEL
ncbi:MAG: VWA-like domain-containing protein [Bacteroidales bacterium]|nr:VWA-like domain-containing protein [Bacteroidales bacterium]